MLNFYPLLLAWDLDDYFGGDSINETERSAENLLSKEKVGKSCHSYSCSKSESEDKEIAEKVTLFETNVNPPH